MVAKGENLSRKAAVSARDLAAMCLEQQRGGGTVGTGGIMGGGV